MEGKNSNLKPQDIVIILKIVSKAKKTWRIKDLAYELDLSSGEVSNGLERLKTSKLISGDKKTPMINNLKEFLIHGLKYAFPASEGKIERGVLTSYSHEELSNMTVGDTKYVWPYFDGNTRGVSITPLYRNVPKASMNDKKLHRYLALIDCIRVGKVREQVAAMEILKEDLTSYEL